MDTDCDSGVAVVGTDECWALLRSTEVGRLSVGVADEPDIFPVNFAVDHGTIVFRTAPGTKLASVVIAHAVAFEVDGYDPAAGDAWSVALKGRGERITRSQELIDTTGLPLFPWQAGEKHRFVRIVPTDVSGRRFHVVDRSAHRAGPVEATRASGVQPWAPGEHGHWLRLIPHGMTGRRIAPGELPPAFEPFGYL